MTCVTKSSCLAAIALLLSAVLSCCGGLRAHAASLGHIPDQIDLKNAGTGKVCVVGFSLPLGPNVPAYYLSKNAKKQGVWVTPVPATVTGLELGVDINAILSQPTSTNKQKYSPYINAGNIRFYLVNSWTNCASVTPATTDLSFPLALLEVSTYYNGLHNVMTIDTSNVDNFEIPLLMEFSQGGKLVGSIGNPTTPATFNRQTMITGTAGNGNGTGSPFLTWLQRQPGYQSGPNRFAALVRLSNGQAGSYYFSMIDGPTTYLGFKCLNRGSLQLPMWQCPVGNSYIHRDSPLSSYFDSELATFYSNAMGLVVMGDQQPGFPEQPWTVTSTTADCPMYLKNDGHSLLFTSKASGSIVVCNPLGQDVTMGGRTPTYSPGPVYYGKAATATLEITEWQYYYYGNKVGWNLVQPESSWVGNIRSFNKTKSGKYFIDLIVLAAPMHPRNQMPCIPTAQTACATINPVYTTFVFSNVKYTTTTNVNEKPTQMVFGGDGAFNSWLYYSSNPNPYRMIVTQSIERNIVAAMLRGVANCNNLTMTGIKTMPPYCKYVKALPIETCPKTGCVCPDRAPVCVTAAAVIEVPKTRTAPGKTVLASDAYWSNENNWYPATGPQSYYAQYLHTARLNKSGILVPDTTTCTDQTCFNVFATPNGAIGGPAWSIQGVPMGMVYGFSLDETPDYLFGDAVPVPSKLDPIPPGWGTGVGVTVTVGAGG